MRGLSACGHAGCGRVAWCASNASGAAGLGRLRKGRWNSPPASIHMRMAVPGMHAHEHAAGGMPVQETHHGSMHACVGAPWTHGMHNPVRFHVPRSPLPAPPAPPACTSSDNGACTMHALPQLLLLNSQKLGGLLPCTASSGAAHLLDARRHGRLAALVVLPALLRSERALLRAGQLLLLNLLSGLRGNHLEGTALEHGPGHGSCSSRATGTGGRSGCTVGVCCI